MLGMAAACTAVAALAVGCPSARRMMGPAAFRSAFPSARETWEVPPGDASPRSERVYVAEGRSGVLGYAVEKQVVSRSGPFTILVIVDSDFRVKGVEVLSYMSERGREVMNARFRQQFEGKGLRDPIRLGKDTVAETGATISSNAVAGGVRAVLRLLEREFGPAHRR